MAEAEFKLSFTARDIDSKLAKIDPNKTYVTEDALDNRDYVTAQYADEKYVAKEGIDGEIATKEYVDRNTGALVYLSTRELIGENIELPDVYPLQHASSTLQIVSKNRIEYSSDLPVSLNGVTVTATNSDGKYLKVSGKPTSTIDTSDESASLIIGKVTFDIQGKYTISTNNAGVNTSAETKKCYIEYSLFDEQDNVVQNWTTLTTTSAIIDTKELNCYELRFRLVIKATAYDTFNTTAAQSFKIQVEAGEKVTAYSHPRAARECAGKSLDIYGRNLVNPKEVYTNNINTSLFNADGSRTEALTTLPVIGNINDTSYSIQNLGVQYIKSKIITDNIVAINNDVVVKTPLLQNDEFTVVINVTKIADSVANISDIQVVYGYTDYEEYLPYEIDTVISDANGLCDISHLKYPYSLISIHNFDSSNDGLAAYIKYDPALSRDWTERQLASIDKRLDYIEVNGTVGGGAGSSGIGNFSNYYTKDEIDQALAGLDKIVVSESEPIVAAETVWLQPLTTDTGAIDYIVEQGIQDNAYYEKWNSGIVKYHASITETVSSGVTSQESYITIPKSICTNILTHNITINNLTTTTANSINVVQNGISDNTSEYIKIRYTLFFTSMDMTFTTGHSIIGFWK